MEDTVKKKKKKKEVGLGKKFSIKCYFPSDFLSFKFHWNTINYCLILASDKSCSLYIQ